MSKIISAVIYIASCAGLVASVGTITVLGEIRKEIRMHDVVSEFSDKTCSAHAVNPDFIFNDRHSANVVNVALEDGR